MFNPAQQEEIKRITREAGAMLAGFFVDPRYRQSRIKGDGSPVTKADQAVSEFLERELSRLGFPVVSEERDLKEGLQGPYFIVDPLDGTKYFAQGERDFAVLVGFVDQGKPVLGSICAPLSGNLYFGSQGAGAFKNDDKINRPSPSVKVVAYSSGFHKRPAREWICREMGIGEILERGSALKFCGMAMGRADFFPRFGPTGEWDTAGAQVILEESGCAIVDIRTGEPLEYGKPRRINQGFVACHASLLPKVRALLANYVWPKMRS